MRLRWRGEMGNETNLSDLPKVIIKPIKETQSRSKDFFQIMLCHGSLLILTQEEFQKAIHRGESVIHNRLLKTRVLDPDILKGRLIQKEENGRSTK
jgi:hypothetical protein